VSLTKVIVRIQKTYKKSIFIKNINHEMVECDNNEKHQTNNQVEKILLCF
jgi:hypothetical protein